MLILFYIFFGSRNKDATKSIFLLEPRN